jgi:hypothetical protein
LRLNARFNRKVADPLTICIGNGFSVNLHFLAFENLHGWMGNMGAREDFRKDA